MARDLEGKVCPRHPSSPAVSRCFACFKPICELCLVQAEGHDFCSETCATAHIRTDRTMQEYQEKERLLRRQRRIRRWITFGVVVVIGYLALRFWIHNPELVEGWYDAIVGLVDAVTGTIKDTFSGMFK